MQQHRRAEMFTQKSPFAAFKVMVQKGVVNVSQDIVEENKSENLDCKL